MEYGINQATRKKDLLSMFKIADSKTEKMSSIIQRIYKSKPSNLLVVGCGSGIEAAILAQQLDANVIGIDAEGKFNQNASKYAKLYKGNAMALAFEDESFDFVYCYHALEHIKYPQKALSEIYRVLKKGGGYWIGTPNRSRILGYIGSKDATLSEKLHWNLTDWKARLTGKFRNEIGSHAGFTSHELHTLLSEVFSDVDDMTLCYFTTMYKCKFMFRLIVLSGLSGIIYPSVYFGGTK